MNHHTRERALEILQRVDEGAFATPLLDRPADSGRDANFIRTIVLGVLRWRLRLDYVIEDLAERRVAKIDPIALQLLRMGVYQIMFMDVPGYAAVSETVTLASRRAARAKGFVNAVLRKATRSDVHRILPEGDEARRLSVEHAHPLWLVERWIRIYGTARTEKILESNQTLSHPDLLVNEMRVEPGDAAAILRERGIPFEESRLVQGMFRIEGGTSSIAGELQRGLFHAMDEGSALVASLIDVQNQRVLDMAAAPGGKSIRMTMRGGHVTSNDLSLQRLGILRRTHPRFFDERPELVVSDGRTPPFRTGVFHTILLDAPCSATGTIRKNPEIKWRLEKQDLEEFSDLQTALLTACLDLLPAHCLYSTCSMEPEENDEVIERVLRERPRYRRVDLAADLEPRAGKWIRDGILRLTPDSGADGFNAFLLAMS